MTRIGVGGFGGLASALPALGSAVARDAEAPGKCPLDPERVASDGPCLGDDLLDHLGIEIVDHLDFEAIDELPFVVAPANASRVGSDFAEAAPDEVAQEPAADAFATLVDAMTRAMLARGAGPGEVHLLRALVGLERMGDQTPGDAACFALTSAKLAAPSGRALLRTPQFASEVLAWQRILRAESDDLTACGAAPLDEWAATIVASTLGDSSHAASIRRELRGHGVAAFGLVSDAAA